jgi:hypothetical protein
MCTFDYTSNGHNVKAQPGEKEGGRGTAVHMKIFLKGA